MFSVEVGREETGGGGLGHSISNYFPFISKMIDCKLLLLEIFAYVATVSRKSHFQLFFFVFLGQISTKLSYANNGFQLIQQMFCFFSVADPDFEMRGEGGGRSPRKIFWPFGPQFRLKIRGNLSPRAPPLDPPLFSQYRVVVMMGSTRRNFKRRIQNATVS